MGCPNHIVEMFIGCDDSKIKHYLVGQMKEKVFTDLSCWLTDLAIANRPLLDADETVLENWIAAGAYILAPSASDGRFDLPSVQLQKHLQERPQWLASLLIGNDVIVWKTLRNSHDKRPPITLPDDDPHLAQAKNLALSLDSMSDRNFRIRAGMFWDKVLDQAVRLIRDELECINVSEYEKEIIRLAHKARDISPHLYTQAKGLAAWYAKRRAAIHTQVDMVLSALRAGWVFVVIITIVIACSMAIPQQNPRYYNLVYLISFGLGIAYGSLVGDIGGDVVLLRHWSNRKKHNLEKEMNITRS